jgi:hypothetical protein
MDRGGNARCQEWQGTQPERRPSIEQAMAHGRESVVSEFKVINYHSGWTFGQISGFLWLEPFTPLLVCAGGLIGEAFLNK